MKKSESLIRINSRVNESGLTEFKVQKLFWDVGWGCGVQRSGGGVLKFIDGEGISS